MAHYFIFVANTIQINVYMSITKRDEQFDDLLFFFYSKRKISKSENEIIPFNQSLVSMTGFRRLVNDLISFFIFHIVPGLSGSSLIGAFPNWTFYEQIKRRILKKQNGFMYKCTYIFWLIFILKLLFKFRI